MSVPIHSSDDLLAALREHPEWRDAVRKEILTEALLELPERFAKLEERFAKLEERFVDLAERFEKAEAERRDDSRKIWEAIGVLTQRVDALTQRVDALTQRIDSFVDAADRRFRGIELELDYFSGKSMEIDARKKLGNYLRAKVRKIHRCGEDLSDSLIDTALDTGQLSEEEGDDLGEADALAVGKDRETGKPACVAVEASKTVDAHDVDRAARRAELFLKASRAAVAHDPQEFLAVFPALPEKAYALVVGRRITDLARREAERKGVLFAKYGNGHDRDSR